MRAQISNRDYEQLSAYLDGQLTAREQSKLEERLRTRPELQMILDDLRRTKTLLRMAPHRRAPRNFLLTPAMVGQQKTRKSKSTFSNLFSALSFASGLALFALILSLVFQLSPGAPASMTANQPASEVAIAPMTDQSTELAESALPEDRVAKESSGATPEGAVMGSQPLSETPPPGLEAQAEENFGVPSADSVNPPVITWNNNMGSGGGGDGIVGKSVGEYAPAPNGYGLGGGAVDGYGGGAMMADGGILIPLEGVNSLEGANPGEEASPPQIAPKTLIEPGSGPILGIPPTEQAGQIANSSSWGGPFQTGQVITGEGDLVTPPPSTQPGNPMFLVQILLASIAVVTGAAAIFLWRRKIN